MSAETKMFAVLVKYVKPLEQVDAARPAHRAYLRAHCDAGRFVVTGPQVPRTGGLILARAESKEAMRRLLDEDPFHKAGLAEYEIIEFVPTVYSAGFAGLVK